VATDGFRTDVGGLSLAGRQRDASFTIITTDAGPDVAELHDRMPVILEPDDWAMWLGEGAGVPASLLHPSPMGTLRVWPVERLVNSPRNNEVELLTPLATG
jgi:putative SOS response-associated peptidase YedK